MNLWRRISRLSLRQIFKLSVLFASKPLLIVPTLRATKQSMKLCYSLFGGEHHISNRANAFRHALWNLLICRKTMIITQNDLKSVNWTQKFTDLYEKVTQNDILDEMMDLHNNEVGRIAFLQKNHLNHDEIIDYLLKMTQNALKIEEIHDLSKLKNRLVYIKD